MSRELLRQALEALTHIETCIHGHEEIRLGAINDLRAALAAPATESDERAKELETELAATEVAIAEYRQQCLDNAAEVARLKAESEERLQNCAALVAENERLRAAQATAPAQPSWQDAPTKPGLWITTDGQSRPVHWLMCRVTDAEHEASLSAKDEHWFGPIPEDKP